MPIATVSSPNAQARPPVPATRRRSARRAFTLVELMIVVSIVGVLAALAIYGVQKYLRAAKTSEAKDSIGAITRAVVIVFERERAMSQQLAEGTESVGLAHVLCGSANTVPVTIPKSRKYQPISQPGLDFETGTGSMGWSCLNHYSIHNPIYYQYSYHHSDDAADFATAGMATAPVPAGTGFEAAAMGDLDGDSNYSVFARHGEIRNTHLVISTQLFVDQEFE